MHRRTFIKSSLALAGASLIGTGRSSNANQVLISAARDSNLVPMLLGPMGPAWECIPELAE